MLSLYFKYDEKKFFNNILKNSKNKILIVPEQYSFYSEKFVYKNISNLKVFSFKKLCFEIFKKFGYISGNFASKQIKILALNLAVLKFQKQLKNNINSKEQAEINKILNSIEELKKNDISTIFLEKTIKQIKDNFLKTKTKNFLKILNLYEIILKKNFKDPTENIKKAIQFSIKNKIFQGKEIYFLFFFRFNISELKLIEIMIKQANLTFLIPFEKNQPLFKITENSINKIVEIAKKNNIKIVKKIDNNYLKKENTAKKIEKNIFRENIKTNNLKQKNKIKIYIANNKQTEIEKALEKAAFLNKNGVKWKEIAILSQNIKYYKSELKTTIENFNIPYFFNENVYPNNMLIIKIAKNILEISVSFNIEIFLTILKSNLTKFTIEEIAHFEKITNNFNENKVKNPTEKEIKTIKNYEKVEKTLNKLLNCFKKSYNNSKDISIMLIKSFIILGVKNKIENEIKNKNELENLLKEWETLVEILENIYKLTKNKTITKQIFKLLFNSVCNETKIEKIPQNKDCVLIANLQKETPKDKKAIIFLTSNEEFPLKKKYSEEFFTDEEIKYLKKLNLKFLLTSDEKNLVEKFLTYKAISASLKYIYIFYTKKDKKQDIYNEVIDELIKIFGKDIIEKIEERSYINSCITKKVAFKKLLLHYKEETKETYALKQYFNKKVEILKDKSKTTKTKINLEEYFDKSLSPTQIEQFHLCQFSFFCKHILKIEQTQNKENILIFGNITHKILEKIVSLKNFLNLTEEEILKEIENNLNYIINLNFPINQKNSKYEINLFYQLKEDLKKLCINIQNELKILDFKPLFFEYKISNTSKIKPLQIKINDKILVSINGIIDRIDIQKIENRNFLRIIDYKYNKKTLNFKDLVSGLNLQIILYLLTLEKNIKEKDNTEIIGVFYFPTIGALRKYETFKKKPEIKKIKNIKEKLKPIAMLIDSNETKIILDKIKSDIYKEYSPIKTTKENLIYKKDEEKTIISKNELKIFLNLIENKIRKIFYSIKNLEFCKNPIKLPQNNVLYCDYCEFKEICEKEKIKKQQNQKNLGKSEFLQYIENENMEQNA